jgi:hypothetical protein
MREVGLFLDSERDTCSISKASSSAPISLIDNNIIIDVVDTIDNIEITNYTCGRKEPGP